MFLFTTRRTTSTACRVSQSRTLAKPVTQRTLLLTSTRTISHKVQVTRFNAISNLTTGKRLYATSKDLPNNNNNTNNNDKNNTADRDIDYTFHPADSDFSRHSPKEADRPLSEKEKRDAESGFIVGDPILPHIVSHQWELHRLTPPNPNFSGIIPGMPLPPAPTGPPEVVPKPIQETEDFMKSRLEEDRLRDMTLNRQPPTLLERSEPEISDIRAYEAKVQSYEDVAKIILMMFVLGFFWSYLEEERESRKREEARMHNVGEATGDENPHPRIDLW